MEDHKKYPPLPSNYVTIVQLQERWLKSQQLNQTNQQQQPPPPKPEEEEQEKLSDDSIRVSENPTEQQLHQEKLGDEEIRVSEERIDQECDEEKVGDEVISVLENQKNGVETVSGSSSARIWKPKRNKSGKRKKRSRKPEPEDSEVGGGGVVTGNEIADREVNVDESKKEKKWKTKKKNRKKKEVKPRAEENVGGVTAESPPVNDGEVRGEKVRDGTGERKEVRYEYRKKIRNEAVEAEAPAKNPANDVVETRRRFEDLSVNRRSRFGRRGGHQSYGDYGRSDRQRNSGDSRMVWMKKGEVSDGGMNEVQELH